MSVDTRTAAVNELADDIDGYDPTCICNECISANTLRALVEERDTLTARVRELEAQLSDARQWQNANATAAVTIAQEAGYTMEIPRKPSPPENRTLKEGQRPTR